MIYENYYVYFCFKSVYQTFNGQCKQRELQCVNTYQAGSSRFAGHQSWICNEDEITSTHPASSSKHSCDLCISIHLLYIIKLSTTMDSKMNELSSCCLQQPHCSLNLLKAYIYKAYKYVLFLTEYKV